MRFYYVYRITNTFAKKHYYGKRTCKVHPKADLGIKYFSSSKDTNFIQDQKKNPQYYKYKVLKICSTSLDAIALEIKLHNKFNVGLNPNFYNMCKQTSTGFDTTGIKLSKERIQKIREYVHPPLSIEHKKRISEALKGNSWNIGRKHSQAAIDRMKAVAKKGFKNPAAVAVNIYKYETGELIASNVVLFEWCKGNNSLRSNLAATLSYNVNKPASKHNMKQSHGYYARYVNVEQTRPHVGRRSFLSDTKCNLHHTE